MSNEEIRVVIADDEPGMRMIMRKMIEKAVGFTLCGEADNGPDLLKLVEQYKPQVCFLDVEMPGMTGLECAKAIQDTDPRTILVFATAHEDYMAQAFEVYAFDYMVKPFKVERVMKTLERIRQVIGGRAQPQSEQAEKLEEHIKAIPARGASSGRIMLHHKEGVSVMPSMVTSAEKNAPERKRRMMTSALSDARKRSRKTRTSPDKSPLSEMGSSSMKAPPSGRNTPLG